MLKNVWLAIAALFVLMDGWGQNLVINELIASNQNTITDEFAEFDDWVEIYNPTGESIDLAGYFLSDNPNNLMKWMFPVTAPGETEIAANGYLIIWCDNTVEQGPLHTNFRLSADGEAVYLTGPDGVTVIDSIEFGAQQTDISYGRTCDACPNWTFFNVPTPNAANAQSDPTTDILFINEVMTGNTAYPFWVDEFGQQDRWFEIYNPNPYQVNLAGYFVSINAASPFQYMFPNTNPVSTTIDANGFMIFWADNQSFQGANHTNFLLPNSGTLTLRGPDLSVVSSFTWPAIPQNSSYGRAVDGGLALVTFADPTPRASNTILVLQPENLFINEVMASNASDTTDVLGDFDDWFEIYNPNTYPVDLAGYYLSDNPDIPDKWRVPENAGALSVIPAQGYKLFFADTDTEIAWNHTNFRLNGSTGEWLILRGPDGFTIIDQISWTQMLPDTSLGRFTDGGLPWVDFIDTTPEYSNNGATINVDESKLPVTQVYPNPVAVGMPIQLSRQAKVEVYNTAGQRVASHPLGTQIPTDQLRAGMYILLINDFQRVKLLVN